MEQMGTSGLPPLMPSLPVPVQVSEPEDIVEEVVEQELCSLTELVPVRSKQPSSAAEQMLEEEMIDDPLEEQLEEVTSAMHEDPRELKNVLLLQKLEPSEGALRSLTERQEANSLSIIALEPISEARSETASISPVFQVPPHILGRTVDNPLADIPPGRRNVKPRLGVKVPYRNLTSQIVTQNEIAQEIFERTAKNHPEMIGNRPSVPATLGKSEIFTRKLTERLASSITSPSTKPKTAVVPESMGTLKALLPNKTVAPIVDGLRLSPGFTYSEKDKGMDDAELLSILEGDGDPLWLPDNLLRKTENTPADPISVGAAAPVLAPVVGSPSATPAAGAAAPGSPQIVSPPKLDPAVEKELALKQLMELPIAFPSKKPEKKDKSERRPRRKGPKANEEPSGINAADGVVEQTAALPESNAVINGGNAENAPPAAIPVKKAPSSRKRKITPDVEAVLKKSKISKKVEAEPVSKVNTGAKSEVAAKVDGAKSDAALKAETVANGKAKGGKANTPVEPGKRKVVASRKAAQSKPDPEPVINGSAETNRKKRGSKNRTEEDTAPKKPAVKSSPAKTAKSPKAASKTAAQNKSQAPTLSGKQQKAAETVVEKVAEEAEDQAMDVIEEEAPPTLEPVEVAQPPPQPQQKKPTRINRELEHLLGDEGAVNMMYAVEGHHKSKVPSKDLALKARLVKTAVMRLSASPQGHIPLALRARRSLNTTEPPKLVKMGGNRKQRHLSSESLDSMRSPPYLTPVDAQSFSPRQKLTADDSRIIRRHSSSSSFSSPSVSPRRVSVEVGTAQGIAGTSASSAGTSGSPRKRGVPIFVPKAKSLTYDGRKKNKVTINPAVLQEQLRELQSKKLPNYLINPAALKQKDQRKVISEANGKVKSELKKMKKGIDTPASLTAKIAKLRKMQLLAKRKAAEEIAKANKAEEELRQFEEEAELAEDQVLPVIPTIIKQEGKKSSSPQSPDATSEACQCTFGACLASCARCVTGPLFCVSPTGYSNLVKSLHPKAKKAHAEERQRATLRHCAGTYNYKEITVRRYDNIGHVILAPVSTKLSSALNVQVLRELRDALQQLRKDDQCKVVLLTSSGSIFCQGVDLSALIHSNSDKRKTAAFEMSLALKDLLKCIAHFPKPLVAGVQGAAIGLGVTMLPLFDMVFASDKATFHTPYAQMGQVPEGGASLTLPQMLGHTATSELLLNCRKLTAKEALQFGLVTRVLWPDRFMEELIPVVKNIAQHSAQAMEATKALLRHGLRTKFDAALESETHLVVEHWTSKECQASFQRMLDSGEICVQRQRSVDA